MKKMDFILKYLYKFKRMKIYMQQLHEEEEKMRRESFKLLRDETATETDHLKTVRLLFFSKTMPSIINDNDVNSRRLKSFQRSFDTLKKLNKPITVLNVNPDELASVPALASVDLSVGDALSDQVDKSRSNTVSLCSNLDFIRSRTASLRPVSHSTLIFEHSGVRLGFIALFDEAYLNKHSIGRQHIFKDPVAEANRLSQQLRACGVSLVVAVANFEDAGSESRLLTECGASLDLVLTSTSTPSSSGDVFKAATDEPKSMAHFIKFEPNSLDYLYLLTMRVDPLSSTSIAQIDLDKYYIE